MEREQHLPGADLTEIEFPCPGCGQQQRQTLRWLRDHRELACGGCGRIIALDNDQLRAGLDQVDQSFADLVRKLRGQH